MVAAGDVDVWRDRALKRANPDSSSRRAVRGDGPDADPLAARQGDDLLGHTGRLPGYSVADASRRATQPASRGEARLMP